MCGISLLLLLQFRFQQCYRNTMSRSGFLNFNFQYLSFWRLSCVCEYNFADLCDFLFILSFSVKNTKASSFYIRLPLIKDIRCLNLWLTSQYVLQPPIRAPVSLIMFINDALPSLSHQRFSLAISGRSLGQLKVWDPIWRFSHKNTVCQSREAPVVWANLQQLSKSCPGVVEKRGFWKTECLQIVILHTNVSLSAQEKVVISGKALKGKIYEY